MGLDMYFKKHTYIGNKYREKDKQVQVIIPKDQEGVIFPTVNIKQERICTIIEKVGYWRKANAIHQWFVENVQGGEDDCGDYYVSKEQMQELLDLCLKVKEVAKLEDGKVANGRMLVKGAWVTQWEDGVTISNPQEVAELLPTSSGFFFGRKDYDEWYMQHIDITIDIMKQAIEEKGDYYYHSSW